MSEQQDYERKAQRIAKAYKESGGRGMMGLPAWATARASSVEYGEDRPQIPIPEEAGDE